MVTAVDYVALQARLDPARPAAADLASGRQWSYAALDEDIARCVGALVGRGVGTGDRVAALARNRVDLVVLHLACARLGAIYVPLNWRLSPLELRAQLDDCKPALLVGDEHLVAAGLEGLDLDAFVAELARTAPSETTPGDPDAPCLILYTSGTSGQPKGVLLSVRNLSATAINFGLLGAVERGDAILCEAPMFHVIGLITCVWPFLMRGARILVSDGFVPPRTLARLGDPELAVTHYFCVPQMAATLRAEPDFVPARLSGLKAMFTGGAPHAPAAIRAWLADGVAMVDGYGMSEAGTVFGMPLAPGLIAARAGSAGLAAPGVATRIVDDAGADVGPDQTGELLLRGDNVTRGYWRRPEETKAAFVDGWLRTGDIVRADAAGYHWIVGRKKEMFISGGENVYPGEIEAVVAEHPDVRECAVVGAPDARWGEVGVLFAVARSTACAESELLEFIAARLARYKAPKRVVWLDALPRNAAGKIVKSQLPLT